MSRRLNKPGNSANMEHPQALAEANKSGPVVLFARNKLCALVRPGVCTENLGPGVVMMKSAEYRVRTDDSSALNRTRDRRIFIQ